MEEALRTVLKNTAAITALVGTRIDWGARQQGAGSPSVVLYRIGGERGQHLAGADGLTVSRVQVDCWGQTYGAAKGVARQVVLALNAYRSGGIRRVFVDAERDDSDLSAPDPLFRTSLDLMVWHTLA